MYKTETIALIACGGVGCDKREEVGEFKAQVAAEAVSLRARYPHDIILSGCVACSGCTLLENGLRRCTLEVRHPEDRTNPMVPRRGTDSAETCLGALAVFNPDGATVTELPAPAVPELPARRVA